MKKIRKWDWKSLLLVSFILFSMSMIYHQQARSTLEINNRPSKTWITMSLCWSANAHVLGKDHFPYKESVPLSTQLWHQFTPAQVILQIIYSESQISAELKDYKTHLESLGAKVFLIPTGNDIQCVLKSQLQRLLAYLLPFIEDQDIVVTADVDAFVMTSDLYKPLMLPNKQIWLYRYALTLDTTSTFMMPFIGIRKSVWKTLFKYDSSQDDLEAGLLGNGLPKMIATYDALLNFTGGAWSIDQDIFTHEILSTGLCSLPKKHVLWDRLKIDPKIPREFNDSQTCWHGSAIYEDCNNASWERNMKIRYLGHNCKWWHFTPQERYPALKSKFDEIMSGNAESQLVNYVFNAAKKFKNTIFS